MCGHPTHTRECSVVSLLTYWITPVIPRYVYREMYGTESSPPFPPSETHRPVVVEVAEFVGEPLHVVWFQASGVVDDVEVGWGDCALTHALTHQEKIIPTQSTDRGERGEGRREGGRTSERQTMDKGLHCNTLVHNSCYHSLCSC